MRAQTTEEDKEEANGFRREDDDDEVSTPAPKREEKSSSVWSFTSSSSRGKVNVFEEFRCCLFQMKESESKMLYYIKRRFALFHSHSVVFVR